MKQIDPINNKNNVKINVNKNKNKNKFTDKSINNINNNSS